MSPEEVPTSGVFAALLTIVTVGITFCAALIGLGILIGVNLQ